MPAAQRQQQILRCAFSLIREQGFKTVSVRDIARAAQINEALIYKYFPSKEALLWAVVRELIDGQPVHTMIPAQDKADFQRQLQQFVEYFLPRALGDPSVTRIIMYAVMENFPLPDEFNIHKEGAFLNWLVRCIEKGKAEWGFNRQVDTLVYVSLFMGGLIYYVLQTAVVKSFPNSAGSNIEGAYVGLFLKSLEE
jgi:AcrR family transcriptional regulator